MNLYRSVGYVRQYTASWCTGAATQMMGNFARLTASPDGWIDRYYFRQRAIVQYAKARDTLTRSSGTDPLGWSAALNRYAVGGTYHWRSFDTFNAALRHAVERMRATNRPVALLAWHGKHAWVLHGFTATADPATTSSYKVTSVRVTGPLAGVDPRNGALSPTTLAARWGRYYERDGYMGWYGKYLLVSP
jgi:hypothetical protein